MFLPGTRKGRTGWNVSIFHFESTGFLTASQNQKGLLQLTKNGICPELFCRIGD